MNLKNEISSFIQKNQNVDAIVLKSKSPSCGSGTTKILDKKGDFLYFGDGLAVEIFKNSYKDINIVDENIYCHSIAN